MSRQSSYKEKAFDKLHPFLVLDQQSSEQQIISLISSQSTCEISNQMDIDYEDQSFECFLNNSVSDEVIDKITQTFDDLDCANEQSVIDSEFDLINDSTIENLMIEEACMHMSVQEEFLKDFAKISIEEKVSSTLINKILSKMSDTICPGKHLKLLLIIISNNCEIFRMS